MPSKAFILFSFFYFLNSHVTFQKRQRFRPSSMYLYCGAPRGRLKKYIGFGESLPTKKKCYEAEVR